VNGALLILMTLFSISYVWSIACEGKSRSVVIAMAKCVVPLLVFTLVLFVSVPSGLGAYLPWFLQAAQFGYRFITYANLALLIGLIGLSFDSIRLGQFAGATVSAMCMLAALNIYVIVSNPMLGDPSMGRAHLTSFGGVAYSVSTDAELSNALARWKSDMTSGDVLPVASMDLFSTQRLFVGPPGPVAAVIVVEKKGKFTPLQCRVGDAILTDVVAFPWNGIADDVGTIGKDRLFQVQGRMGFICADGTRAVAYLDRTPIAFCLAMEAARIVFLIWGSTLFLGGLRLVCNLYPQWRLRLAALH
jgi:hypothetical protein